MRLVKNRSGNANILSIDFCKEVCKEETISSLRLSLDVSPDDVLHHEHCQVQCQGFPGDIITAENFPWKITLDANLQPRYASLYRQFAKLDRFLNDVSF